jgi:hypothetical protein
MALLGVFFSLMNVLPPLAIAGIVFFALTIAAHVAGNAIGCRLRANGDQPVDAGGQPVRPARASMLRPRCAPATELSRRRPLGWPIVVATVAGALAGGIGGALFSILLSGPRLVPLSVVVGAVAFATLGGIAAFLTFSFAQVGLSALAQALRSSRSADE